MSILSDERDNRASFTFKALERVLRFPVVFGSLSNRCGWQAMCDLGFKRGERRGRKILIPQGKRGRGVFDFTVRSLRTRSCAYLTALQTVDQNMETTVPVHIQDR